MLRYAFCLAIVALTYVGTVSPASAERCSVFEDVKATIEKAETKAQIIDGLKIIETLSGDDVNDIVGRYTDADHFRSDALEEVDKKMAGCTKDPQ